MTKENSRALFESFFSKEYKKLVNYVRKNMEERFFEASAEDIIQDVALSLISKLDVNAQIENFAAYMYRSLKNKIIDGNRKSTNEVPLENYSTNEWLKTLPDDSHVEETNLRSNNYELLYKAISQLKPYEQELIKATEFEGRTFEELSEEWNEPIGTLLSRKHRSMAKLNRILTENSL